MIVRISWGASSASLTSEASGYWQQNRRRRPCLAKPVLAFRSSSLENENEGPRASFEHCVMKAWDRMSTSFPIAAHRSRLSTDHRRCHSLHWPVHGDLVSCHTLSANRLTLAVARMWFEKRLTDMRLGRVCGCSSCRTRFPVGPVRGIRDRTA